MIDSNLPRAEIMVNGKKRKLYGKKQNKIYLNDGDEFQIRLFNPFQERVGVALKLNGEYDTDKLLVLNPGQDFVLDRFLSDRKKFTFKTYKVNGNSEQVKEAIARNGLVEIEFWNEKKYTITPNPTVRTNWNIYTYYTPPPPPVYVPPVYPVYTNTPISGTPNNININIDINGMNISGGTYNSNTSLFSGTSGLAGASGTSGTGGTGGLPHFKNISITNSNSRMYSKWDPIIGSGCGSDDINYSQYVAESLTSNIDYSQYLAEATQEKKIETGRIEEGKKSHQKFDEITFERGTVFHREKYKLLPFSMLEESKKKTPIVSK